MNSSSSQRLIEIAEKLGGVGLSEKGDFMGTRPELLDNTPLNKAAAIADEIAERFQGVNSELVSVWREISASLKGIGKEFSEKTSELIESILKFANRSVVNEVEIRRVAGNASTDLENIMASLGFTKGE